MNDGDKGKAQEAFKHLASTATRAAITVGGAMLSNRKNTVIAVGGSMLSDRKHTDSTVGGLMLNERKRSHYCEWLDAEQQETQSLLWVAQC